MKKRLILLVLELIPVFACFATEKMVVDKLLYKPTDLTASTNPRLDNNSKPCGLLKVITTDMSMTFEGSVVGDVEYKNGEYWVYLTEGTYMLNIKASEKEPLMLNFKDYNLQKVESKGTYELTFLIDEYGVLDMREYKIIEGPKLKKYAIQILALPNGWTINGLSSLDYLKRISRVIATDGDIWGEKYECSILAYYSSNNSIKHYRLIIESSDDEGYAFLGIAASYGFVDEKIFVVKY